MTLPSRPLLHIAERAVWEAEEGSDYRVPSLEIEGFIHLSHPDQVTATAKRFYQGRADLVLLVIDPARLTVPVREDVVPGHGTFPHLYGPLNRNAVVGVAPFAPDLDAAQIIPHHF